MDAVMRAVELRAVLLLGTATISCRQAVAWPVARTPMVFLGAHHFCGLVATALVLVLRVAVGDIVRDPFFQWPCKCW
eukprot:COSAG01_NODE_16745_length_1208_cov_4.065825_1_plen_77_part_00